MTRALPVDECAAAPSLSLQGGDLPRERPDLPETAPGTSQRCQGLLRPRKATPGAISIAHGVCYTGCTVLGTACLRERRALQRCVATLALHAASCLHRLCQHLTTLQQPHHRAARARTEVRKHACHHAISNSFGSYCPSH